MPIPLRALIVEDDADDAALVVRQLLRAGFDLESRLVEDAAGLADALQSAEWDLVLADYNLPGFSGLEALRMITSRGIDVPLVLVSGAIDVPTALEAMKAGAKDFVLKGDTQRLPSVIERELAESAQRRRRRKAEAQRDQALADLREANEQLREFVGLTDVPLYSTSADKVVEALLTRLVSILHADGAALLGIEGDHLATRGAVGCSTGIRGDVPLGRGFVGAIAAENRAMQLHDTDQGGGVSDPSTSSRGVGTSLGVPMHLDGRVTGVLHVDWVTPHESPDWLPALLEIAADRCALTMENARYYGREHLIANTLQQALLTVSTDLPGLEVGHFYGSATVDTLVGGDFYDVFETVPGFVAFSIGDVSGKGLGAAAVTALVKNTMRAHAIDGDAPDVVMSKSNEVVGRFSSPETFVTAIFGVLDVASREVSICTAGHPAPTIVGRRGARQLETGGPILGMFSGSSYESATIVLAPGEVVVMFSDGITEARDEAGVFYGEPRLLAFLDGLAGEGSVSIARRLHDEVWSFCSGNLRDDTAVLTFQPIVTVHD
jgi:FixJ family two-component response regulator